MPLQVRKDSQEQIDRMQPGIIVLCICVFFCRARHSWEDDAGMPCQLGHFVSPMRSTSVAHVESILKTVSLFIPIVDVLQYST